MPIWFSCQCTNGSLSIMFFRQILKDRSHQYGFRFLSRIRTAYSITVPTERRINSNSVFNSLHINYITIPSAIHCPTIESSIQFLAQLFITIHSALQFPDQPPKSPPKKCNSLKSPDHLFISSFSDSQTSFLL
jgi:hypothetical protein